MRLQIIRVCAAVSNLLFSLFWQDLDEAGASWRVYFELVPTSWQFTYTRGHLDNYRLFDDLMQDAAAGTLANYTFIDPRYYELLG